MLRYALQIIGTEWIWIVFLVVFLLFGSKKLPELSRALGKAMGEFQKGRDEIEREFRLATATPHPPPKNLKTGYRPGSRFAKAAESMGLESKGKSDEELRKEILNFLRDQREKKKESSKDKQKTNTEPKPK
ncbi:MAG: twin-arginine translocase TatA/TatE family subunit [Nitrososphaerales archaeon]